MAWLHDNGDENEYSQFEEDEGGEKDEGLLEETEEEVTIVERPGVPWRRALRAETQATQPVQPKRKRRRRRRRSRRQKRGPRTRRSKSSKKKASRKSSTRKKKR